MSLRTADPPAALLTAFADGLAAARTTTSWDAPPVRIKSPLALFVPRGDRLGNGLPCPTDQIGWRCLVEGPALADVVSNDEAWRFAGVERGPPVERFLAAIETAEPLVSTEDVWTIGMVEIPELHASALWLSGPDNLFIPVSDPRPDHEAVAERDWPGRMVALAKAVATAADHQRGKR